jgi:hypothetical protein
MIYILPLNVFGRLLPSTKPLDKHAKKYTHVTIVHFLSIWPLVFHLSLSGFCRLMLHLLLKTTSITDHPLLNSVRERCDYLTHDNAERDPIKREPRSRTYLARNW